MTSKNQLYFSISSTAMAWTYVFSLCAVLLSCKLENEDRKRRRISEQSSAFDEIIHCNISQLEPG